MKWPFVSRVAFEIACQRADSEHENAQFLRRDAMNSAEQWAALVTKGEDKYADLLARYHTLRLQGAVPVTPVAVRPPLDPIASAIARRSGGDPELRNLMTEQALRDKAEGKSDGDILAAIMIGQSTTTENDGTFI